MKTFKEFLKETKLYYPTINAVRGTDQQTTSWDPSKTYPTQDSTLLVPMPKKKKKKIKKSKKD